MDSERPEYEEGEYNEWHLEETYLPPKSPTLTPLKAMMG